MNSSLQIATIILDQLGGNRFCVMVGAKNFVATGNGVKFRIGRNAKHVNTVKITLNHLDSYDVEYLSIRGAKVKRLASEEGIYADQLRESFERNTGMACSLGTMGR